jgi:curved DNA-binding protein CbpA
MSAEKILLEDCLADLGIDKAQFYILKKPEQKDTLLKEQYKKLALQVHPDKASPEERPVATEKFKKLASAYETAKTLHPKVQAQNTSSPATTPHFSFFSTLSKVALSDEQIKAIFYSVLDENERKIENLSEKYRECNQLLDEQYNAESTKVWGAQFAQYQANSKKYYQAYQDKCYQDGVDKAYQQYQQLFANKINDSKNLINLNYDKKIDAAWTTTKISLFLFILVIPLFVALGAFIYYNSLLSEKEEKLREADSKTCKTKADYQGDASLFPKKEVWITNNPACKSYADWERDIRYNDLATFKANYLESDEGKLAVQQLSPLSSAVTQQKLRNQGLYEAAKGWNSSPDSAAEFIVGRVTLS